jgi:Flp pilus assembly protein TadG
MARQMRDQRGVMALEFMMVISAVIVVFLVMLQYAVRAHAHSIATAAAEEGLAAASAYDGTADLGQSTATDYLDRLGPGLNHARVTVTRNPTTAAVTIEGDVEQLIPFLTVRVSVHIEGPTEHFVESP